MNFFRHSNPSAYAVAIDECFTITINIQYNHRHGILWSSYERTQQNGCVYGLMKANQYPAAIDFLVAQKIIQQKKKKQETRE